VAREDVAPRVVWVKAPSSPIKELLVLPQKKGEGEELTGKSALALAAFELAVICTIGGNGSCRAAKVTIDAVIGSTAKNDVGDSRRSYCSISKVTGLRLGRMTGS
jgi:hypothetical protein